MRLGATKASATSSYNGLGNQLYDLGGARPSLDLNFAGNKTLQDNISTKNLIDFTRASSGTYVGSDGLIKTATTNEARFDHNPTTGESLGLLVEESRTNLCLQSAAISTSPWAPNGTETCVASTLIDPAGGLNAFKINFGGSVSFERWQQAITVVNGTTYTLSAWVRSTSGTASFRLRFVGGVTSSDLTATTTWQRFTFTLTAGTTAGFFAFNAASTGAASEIHVWGAQLEAGDFPTSYIPTTTAAVTRSADVASITGSNFSSWYRQDQSTVYCQGLIPPGLSAFPTLHMASDGSVNNQWSQYAHTSGLYANLRTGNVGQGDPGVIGSPVVGAAYRLATGFIENNVCTAWNGTVGTPDTSASMPTALSEFRIGAARTGGAVINTTISRLTYFPTRLPNSTLQQITQ